MHLRLHVNILCSFIACFVISYLVFLLITNVFLVLEDRYGLGGIAHSTYLRPRMVLIMRLVLEMMSLLHLLAWTNLTRVYITIFVFKVSPRIGLICLVDDPVVNVPHIAMTDSLLLMVTEGSFAAI